MRHAVRAVVRPAIILLLVTALPAGAQELSSTPPVMHTTGLAGGVYTLGSHIGHDFASQASYPFSLARRDPLRFALGAGVMLGLIFTDNATHKAIATPAFVESHGLDGPAQFLSGAASPSRMIPLAAGIGAISLFGPPHERQTGLMLTEALVTSAAWTGALKYLTGRERPRETTEIAADWTGPGASFTSEPIDGRGLRSFPSGHTSGTWAIATVLAHQYPTHGIVPVLAYGTAAAMGYSRMAVGAHWLSDVVAGGLIGYGCARQVIAAHESAAPVHPDDAGWHLFVGSDQGVRGAGLSYRF